MNEEPRYLTIEELDFVTKLSFSDEKLWQPGKDVKSKRYLKNVAKIYPNVGGSMGKIKLFRFWELTPVGGQKKTNTKLVPPPVQASFEDVQEYELKKADSQKKSRGRSKTILNDLISCNPWDWFLTLTFDPKKYPLDDDEIRYKLATKWLNNQQSKHLKLFGSKFAYILVPERHKSGAIHLHLLVNDYRGKVTPVINGPLTKNGLPNKRVGQPLIKWGRAVYHFDEWRYGITDATRVVNEEALAIYVQKYISKELDSTIQKEFKRRFWHSKGLVTVGKAYNVTEADIEALGADVEHKKQPYAGEMALVQEYPLLENREHTLKREREALIKEYNS